MLQEITSTSRISTLPGHERITVEVALALCDGFDLSLDWIYWGKHGKIPARILKAIEGPERLDVQRRRLRDERR